MPVLLTPQVLQEKVEVIQQIVDQWKTIQEQLPRSPGARAFAEGITCIETGLHWMDKVGCHRYELKE